MALAAALMLKQDNLPGTIRAYKRSLIQQLSNEDQGKCSISRQVDCHVSTVDRWQKREDIYDMPRSGRPVTFDDKVRSLLISFYCQTRPFCDSGRWTIRFASRYLDSHPEITGFSISKTSIHRILSENDLKPHRSRYFLHISDPDFFPKMTHLICLYNNPPINLYCFDECPGIQVLQRLSPDLRTEKMKIWIEEFEYIRNGTTDILALLNVNTGEVITECRSNHTKETIVEVFETYLERAPKDQQLDYIMDNLNSHCCYELCRLVAKYSKINCPPEKELDTMDKRRKWLMRKDKRIIFHYTPYHGSWLNQVEYWFGMLNAKCLHETYHSPDALHRAIKAYENFWNSILVKPFQWKYTGEGLHEKVVKRFTGMLYNTIKIDGRFLVKQLKLHANIAKDYWEFVDLTTWESLYQKITDQQYMIEYVIAMAKKKKIEEDLKSLEILKSVLKKKLNFLLDHAA